LEKLGKDVERKILHNSSFNSTWRMKLKKGESAFEHMISKGKDTGELKTIGGDCHENRS